MFVVLVLFCCITQNTFFLNPDSVHLSPICLSLEAHTQSSVVDFDPDILAIRGVNIIDEANATTCIYIYISTVKYFYCVSICT